MVVTYRQTLNDRQEVCTRDTCMGSTGLLSRPTRFDYAASHFVYIFGDFFSKDDVFLFFSPTFCRFRQSTNSRCQSKQVPPVVIFKSTLIFLENNLSSLFSFSFWSHIIILWEEYLKEPMCVCSEWHQGNVQNARIYSLATFVTNQSPADYPSAASCFLFNIILKTSRERPWLG